MVHIRVFGSQPPSNDKSGLVSWTMDIEVGFNTALYPWSTNCAIDSKALFPMSGKMWHWRASIGMLGWSSRAVCVACIVMLFGRLTMTPWAHGCLFVQCAFVPRK